MKSILFQAALIGSALAHPGHSAAEEALERRTYLDRKPHTVRSCSNQIDSTAFLSRRVELAKRVTKRSFGSLSRRDFAQYNVSHAVSGVQFGGDVLDLFADNSSCTLQSEVTQGPYYVDGELIRTDITEGQEGVPLYLLVQLVDTATCQPAPAVYVDTWHANATGVYSGVTANGNGNTNDTTNLDNTALRGVQQSDIDGIVQIDTIVPGHYVGRTPHIHIMTHNTNTTIHRSNGTILGTAGNFSTHSSHVGQLFFDQDLLTRVGEIEPYASNTQSLTLNEDDSILDQEADTTDPFVRYVQIDENDLSQGILAWISVGIDPRSDEQISSAATIYKDGGVANEDGGLGGGPGGGGGGPGGNSTSGGAPPDMSGTPSGSMSGTSPSGTATRVQEDTT